MACSEKRSRGGVVAEPAGLPVSSRRSTPAAIASHAAEVKPDSLPDDCRVSQVNLNDDTVEGFVVRNRPIFSAQYHPEAAPGPHDANEMFDSFLASLGTSS